MAPMTLRMHIGGGSVVETHQRLIRMHKRVAKTLGVVVTAFLASWLPFFSLYLIGLPLLTPSGRPVPLAPAPGYHCGDCVPGILLDISTWVGYCNSMVPTHLAPLSATAQKGCDR